MGEIKLIPQSLFRTVTELAAQSPRRRMNFNFHDSPSDNPSRLLNVLLAGTYIRPHRHQSPPKAETFLVLEGAADVIVFDDLGAIQASYRLGGDSGEGRIWGIDIPPGIWHTIVARSDRVICFEVKPGPYDPATDKQFADWAPAETDPAAGSYLESLLARRTRVGADPITPREP